MDVAALAGIPNDVCESGGREGNGMMLWDILALRLAL
jgi:hypothetical protein